MALQNQKLTVCGFYKVVCSNKMLILSVSQHTTVNTALAGVFALQLNTSYSIHLCTISPGHHEGTDGLQHYKMLAHNS